jgi:hypothetical protein
MGGLGAGRSLSDITEKMGGNGEQLMKYVHLNTF